MLVLCVCAEGASASEGVSEKVLGCAVMSPIV